jgi:hypothetical protein
MIFVGYEAWSKAYRAYDPRTGLIHVTHDVVFDELAQWDWGNDDGMNGGGDSELLDIELITTMEYNLMSDMDQVEENQGGGLATPLQVGTRTPTPPPAEFASPPSIEPNLDDNHDEEASLRFRTSDNVLGPAAVPGLAERMFQEELHAVSAEEPVSLEEAARDPSWCTAMVEELRSIEENYMWGVVDLLSSHRSIGLKWVFKVKKDEHGHVVKHKA